VKKPRAHPEMSRTAANMLSLLLSPARGAFFSRGLTDQDWKKILRRKKKVWTATQQLVKFFPVKDFFFGQTMPFMSKLKLSVETWVCQEHFILENENLQKPLSDHGIFQSGFLLLLFLNVNSFKNAIF